MSFQTIDDDLSKFGNINSDDLAEQLKVSIEQVMAMMPVGSLYPIMTNIPGCPTPDPNMWQPCEGGEITNPNSPLRSIPGSPRYAPNMTYKFPKITTTLGIIGTSGGVDVLPSLRHNHTTGDANPENPEGANSDSDDMQSTAPQHGSHGVNYALSSTYSMIPLYYRLRWYIKIQ